MNGMNMHWLDITVAAVILSGLVAGALAGFLKQVLRLVTFLLSVYGAFHCHAGVAEILSAPLSNVVAAARKPIAFGLTFLGLYVLIAVAILLARKGIEALLPPPDKRPEINLKWLDRLLGACLGGVMACMLLAPAVTALELIPNAKLQASIQGAKTRPFLVGAMRDVSAVIPESCKNEFLEALNQVKKQGLEAIGEMSKDGLHEAAFLLKELSTEAEKTTR
jgi:uncharacterized membrane protein required for colicin V production